MKLHKHLSSVGSPTIRSDGHPKVTGATHYTGDRNLPGMIWGKCLRNSLPYAQIRRIDVEKASIQRLGEAALEKISRARGYSCEALINRLPNCCDFTLSF